MNNKSKIESIKNSINRVNNHPKPGVVFFDITGIIENKDIYATSIDLLIEKYSNKSITKIVSIESRGFLFGAPVSLGLNVNFVPIRKQGKLPNKKYTENYTMEYDTGELELHKSSINHGDLVLLIDDLLATGGTAETAVKLILRAGGIIIDTAFIVKLTYLSGESRLKTFGLNCFSLVDFHLPR